MTDHGMIKNENAGAWTDKEQACAAKETPKGQAGADRTVQLSARLTAIANMVSRGKRVCDVGCDHGFVSIYLVQKGIAPFVLAMDVGKGPLAQAQKHVEEAGLTGRITTRLSDGLAAYRENEAECLVIAGMGGPLMSRILSDAKAGTFTELVLAPQSEIPQFRRFLDEHGFGIVEEELVYEDGKYYPVMKAVPRTVQIVYGDRRAAAAEDDSARTAEGSGTQATAEESNVRTAAADSGMQITPGNAAERSFTSEKELGYRFGALLLARKHPVLLQYLHKEREKLREILGELENRQGERIEERRNTLRKELYDIEKALERFMQG